MNSEFTIFIIAFVVLFYGYCSRFLHRFNISGPMVFFLLGILFSPLGLDIIKMDLEDEAVKVIAELALIIVLFTDSSSLNLKNLRKNYGVPLRLLFIGLPLTIFMTTYFGTLFFENIPLLYLLVMALILAPTDAALGKAVVVDEAVPQKIRESINVESGLNDGIVFPLLITVLFLITSHSELGHDGSWLHYLFEQILYGSIVGGLSGYIVAKGLNGAEDRGWIQESYKNLTPLSLAIITYFTGEYFGGNGFIAVYVSGLFFGTYSEFLDKNRESFLESEGEVLILISFLVFGLTFIPLTYEYWSFKILFYSLLSLTLFRMLPVFISLIGSGFGFKSKLFIGWFGPRGIASILYVMTVAHHIAVEEVDHELFAVVSLTILLSIIFHGVSASPLVKKFASKLD